uniref:Uncharacterized protein n=1 Tax=Grammatophora oceanica TaxID=210454 RepID=A0A7S1V1M6_9STRA|mmetsp:Transcript_34300/g.50915  ORF Transcript_34300/g.50915 Transcript_34300/m.50915 type:complete len:101 (+) Transcript_34300:239-541(+)
MLVKFLFVQEVTKSECFAYWIGWYRYFCPVAVNRVGVVEKKFSTRGGMKRRVKNSTETRGRQWRKRWLVLAVQKGRTSPAGGANLTVSGQLNECVCRMCV